MVEVPHGALAGVVGSSNLDEHFYASPTAYGWGSDDSNFLGGNLHHDLLPDERCQWTTGDELTFRIDTDASKLLKRLKSTGRMYAMDLPQDVQQWHVHITVVSRGVVEVLPVEPTDELP
jgi:hypothetical protein